MDIRDDFVKVRCTREEKERIKAIAAAEGADVSTLIRRRVFAGAQELPAPAPSLFGEPAADPISATSTTSGVGHPD